MEYKLCWMSAWHTARQTYDERGWAIEASMTSAGGPAALRGFRLQTTYALMRLLRGERDQQRSRRTSHGSYRN